MADIYLLSTSTRSQHEELLLHTDENKMICDWSPDGRYIVYASINPQTKTDLWLLPQFGDRKPVSFLRTGANELQGQISPDGRWIAYTSDESGSWEVYVRSFPEGGSKQVVSIGGGVEPRWRGDGGEIYYLQPNRMLMVVEVQVGSVLSVRRPKELFRTPVASLSVYANHYAVDKSGERFLVDSIETGKRDEPITLLVNWASLAKK
jgi:Tol biopolymer transport system component